MGRLEGKIVSMTAAGAGIGGAAALAFAREGARVIATDRDPATIGVLSGVLDGAYPDAGHEAYTLDVTDHDGLRAAAARHRGVNVLYNGAGWVHQGTLENTSLEDWQRSFDINVTPMFVLTQPGQRTDTPIGPPSSSLNIVSLKPTTAYFEAL